jgi:hypothetical protein
MRFVHKCSKKCGGTLVVGKYLLVFEGQDIREAIKRLKSREGILYIHHCEKCDKYKIYKQPNL